MSRQSRYYSQQSQQYLLDDNEPAPEYRAHSPEPQHQYRDISRSATPSRVFDEPAPTAYHSAYEFDHESPVKTPVTQKLLRTRKRKFTIFGAIAAILVVIIGVAVGVAVYFLKYKFSYTPSDVKVTFADAFTNGGATHNNPNNTNDGIGAGADIYTYYQGTWDKFPTPDKWVSFDDMWKDNLHGIQNSCEFLGYKDNNSPEDIQNMYNAIQNRAAASLVDHRFIFAVILQESHGCVHIHSTNNGVVNPGLMQSHGGTSYNPFHKTLSILAMVQDGTQGTKTGPGLAQLLNDWGNAYSAARVYNSGTVAKDGNLSEAAGATACYVSDIANRLTGWVNAKSTCPGDTTQSG